MKLLVLLAVLGLSSCTDSTMGKFSSYGKSRSIKCYSGSVKIYEGRSTGKIKSEEQSDGYYFVDATTKQLMEVSGNCVIGE